MSLDKYCTTRLIGWGESDDSLRPAISSLNERGLVLLRGSLNQSELASIASAAAQCFLDIERLIQKTGAAGVLDRIPRSHSFNQRSTSVSLVALDDYLSICESGNTTDKVLSILANSPAYEILCDVMGNQILCNLNQARFRKQYALNNYPPLHMPHSWHQDGALGVTFKELPKPNKQPYIQESLTPLITCWIPLTTCGCESPGIKFVTRRLDRLLHYQYLNDRAIAELFEPDEFWSPELKLGDVLIFLNGTLHKTYVTPSMKQDRLSLEFRLFSPYKIPDWMQKDVFKDLSYIRARTS
jgi:hypothetical protein